MSTTQRRTLNGNEFFKILGYSEIPSHKRAAYEQLKKEAREAHLKRKREAYAYNQEWSE